MRLADKVRPVSDLEEYAVDILARLSEDRCPVVITQDGKATAVLQDVASFDEANETLALLKLLLMGEEDIAAGRVRPLVDVVADLRNRTVER